MKKFFLFSLTFFLLTNFSYKLEAMNQVHQEIVDEIVENFEKINFKQNKERNSELAKQIITYLEEKELAFKADFVTKLKKSFRKTSSVNIYELYLCLFIKILDILDIKICKKINPKIQINTDPTLLSLLKTRVLLEETMEFLITKVSPKPKALKASSGSIPTPPLPCRQSPPENHSEKFSYSLDENGSI